MNMMLAFLKGGRTPPVGSATGRSNDAWLVRHEWDARIEQGESFLDIRQRFVPFIEQIVRGEGPLAKSSIVLVGHGGTYRCMLPLVLGNIDFPFVLTHGMGHADMVVAEP